MPSAPFALFAAFSSSPFGGNPAAIVFIHLDTPDDVLRGLSANFNQPMTAFVSKPSEPGKIVHARIRYVTATGVEVALCGHATLCATAAIRALPSYECVEEVHFETVIGKTLVPVKLVDAAQGLLELGLPSAPLLPVAQTEEDRISALLDRAFGKKVAITAIRVGGPQWEHALMVEVDEATQLADAKVDVSVFGETGFVQNVVFSRSSIEGEEYVYRMFCDELPGGEDPVCGTAQCLMAPYWYAKVGLDVGKEITSIAASARRGVLKVTWRERGVLLRGTTAKLASGEVCY